MRSKLRSAHDQRQADQPRDIRDAGPRSADRLFHPDRRPGAGGAENGRAFLATKLGDLAVQLEKGDHAALCASGVPSRARHRVRRHPARHRGRGPTLAGAQRSNARHPQDAGIRGSQGNGLRGVRRPDPDRQEPAGRRHRADQARPSCVRRSGAEGVRRRSIPACSASGCRTGSRTGSSSCAAARIITP